MNGGLVKPPAIPEVPSSNGWFLAIRHGVDELVDAAASDSCHGLCIVGEVVGQPKRAQWPDDRGPPGGSVSNCMRLGFDENAGERRRRRPA
jgi:hypothetical protein